MAHNSNLGRPTGGESDHICAERSRLKQGAQKHFAQRQGASSILREARAGGSRGKQAGDVGRRMASGLSDDAD